MASFGPSARGAPTASVINQSSDRNHAVRSRCGLSEVSSQYIYRFLYNSSSAFRDVFVVMILTHHITMSHQRCCAGHHHGGRLVHMHCKHFIVLCSMYSRTSRPCSVWGTGCFRRCSAHLRCNHLHRFNTRRHGYRINFIDGLHMCASNAWLCDCVPMHAAATSCLMAQ